MKAYNLYAALFTCRENVLFRKIILFGFSEALVKLMPVLTTFILASRVSPEQIGFIALAVILLEIMFILISNNIQATTRIDFFKLPLQHFIIETNRKFTYTALIYSVVLAFISYPIYNNYSQYFLLIFIPLMRVYSQFSLSYCQCSKNTLEYCYIQLAFIIPFTVFFFLFYGDGVVGWSNSYFLASTVQLIFALLIIKKQKIKLSLLLTNNAWKDIYLTFLSGLIFMPQAIGWWIKSAFERYVISLSYGLGMLGVYSFAYQFSSALALLMTAINLTIVPEINTLLKSEHPRRFVKINKIYLYSSLLLAVSTAIISALGVYITEWLYPKYSSGSPYICYALISVFFQSVSVMMMNELYYSDKGKFVSMLIVILSIVQSAFSFVIAQCFSIDVLLVSSIIFNIILLMLTLIKLREVRNVESASYY